MTQEEVDRLQKEIVDLLDVTETYTRHGGLNAVTALRILKIVGIVDEDFEPVADTCDCGED